MRLRRLDAVDAAARESTRLVNVTLSRRSAAAMPRRLDAVDVAARETTRLARESRRCRDGVRSTQDDKLKFAFMIFDEDGNGVITKGELTRILRANHMASCDAEVARKADTIMQQADKDGDGVVTFDEFVIVSKKFPNILFPAYSSSK